MMKLVNFSIFNLLIASLLALSTPANATVVLFKTNMGDIEVNLLDEHTPETVDNFIRYIETGSYQNSIIHRSVPNFITQGGGFNYNIETGNVVDEQKFTAVKNEPEFSNVRGTIAMAKLGSNENSATNQWFFNVADNSSNLDNQNGGFTVFGVVTSGMDFIDDINALDRYDITDQPAFTETPLRAEPAGDGITEEHYVLVESITITNPNEDTQPDLPPESTAKKDDSSSGGGSLFWLLGFCGFSLLRRAAK